MVGDWKDDKFVTCYDYNVTVIETIRIPAISFMGHYENAYTSHIITKQLGQYDEYFKRHGRTGPALIQLNHRLIFYKSTWINGVDQIGNIYHNGTMLYKGRTLVEFVSKFNNINDIDNLLNRKIMRTLDKIMENKKLNNTIEEVLKSRKNKSTKINKHQVMKHQVQKYQFKHN